MLRCYQTPGDAWANTAQDVEAAAEIALKHFRAARLTLVAPASAGAQFTAVEADHATA